MTHEIKELNFWKKINLFIFIYPQRVLDFFFFTKESVRLKSEK
jgi:hypothetical protein